MNTASQNTRPDTARERVLITGGASGIGAAIAERCRAEGFEPVIIDAWANILV